jgi:hypothetical protein
MFGPDSKALAVLVFGLYMKDEWDTRGVLSHYFLKVLHVQVDSLHDDTLVPHTRSLDYLA